MKFLLAAILSLCAISLAAHIQKPFNPFPQAASSFAAGATQTALKPLFREAALETGLNFLHFTGATGEYHLPEIMGAGAALFDYDNDGDLDVYLIQGTMLDDKKKTGRREIPSSERLEAGR